MQLVAFRSSNCVLGLICSCMVVISACDNIKNLLPFIYFYFLVIQFVDYHAESASI